MTRVVGAHGATLAVATPAQAFVLAGLLRLGTRRPVLVVTPTGRRRRPAGPRPRVFADPARGRRRTVEVFPAWETLPFERVSPEVAHHGPAAPAAVASWGVGRPGTGDGDARHRGGPGQGRPAAARALAHRGPTGRRSAGATGSTSTSWWPSWWRMGYRRESIVEHRGELAVRGGIVDVFPSTADEPVRIDLWGDEVDRLTRFDVADQRSIDDLDAVELFGCRELVADEAMRERAAGPGGHRSPGAATSGTGMADGEQFDGMESWLPWLVRRARSCSATCWATTPWWCWSSPAGCGTGPAELLDEEAALADALAATWGCVARGRRPPAARALRPAARPRPTPAVVSLVPTAEGPDVPLVESRGLGAHPGGRDPAGRPGARRWPRPGYAVVLCTSTAGGAERLSGLLAEEGLLVPVARRPRVRDHRPAVDWHAGARIVVAAVDRGFVLPGGQGGRAGRVRRHRPAPTPPPGPHPGPPGRRLLRRPGPGQLRRPPPARGGPLRRHGDPDHGRGHPRLPAARVPGRRQALPAHRPDRAAHPLRRR